MLLWRGLLVVAACLLAVAPLLSLVAALLLAVGGLLGVAALGVA